MTSGVDDCFDLVIDGISPATARDFFNSIANEFVYFYSANDIERKNVTQIIKFGKGELLIPYRTIEGKSYAVMYTNRNVAKSLLEPGFVVVHSKADKFLDIAKNMKEVVGVFVQGNSSWFIVSFIQLDRVGYA